jgi:hypothetical protein
MHPLINNIINQGIDTQHIAYFLLAPLIATIIALLRQIFGIKGLGVYHPLLLTFAFIGLGIEQGLIAFLAITIIANLITWGVKKFPLLYLPRMTIIVTATTLAVLAMIVIIQSTDYHFKIQDYLPIIIIIALSDKLVSATIKRSISTAITMIVSTVGIAVIGFYVLQVTWLQAQVLHYPFIFLVLVIILNIFLGRYKGLRLNEIYRFRQLLKKSFKK